jgi:hypothetical protein
MDVSNLNRARQLLILMGLVLSACAPSPSAIQTAIAETQAAVTKSPTPLPPTPTQWAWKVIQSIFNREQHNDSDIWREDTLAINLEIPGAFEMKVDMESAGSNFIILANVRNRLEMVCEGGTLGVFLRDDTSQMVFDNNSRRPAMPINNGTTTCQITAKFDQYARHIEIYQNNMLIFTLTPEEVGNFPGGLFSDGKILKVYLTSGPRSGSSVSGFTISSVKLNELTLYAQSPVISGSTDANTPPPP